MDKKQFGAKVTELRVSKGMKGKELAEVLNLHPQQISNIERGIIQVSLKRKQYIFSFFGLNYEVLENISTV